MEHLPVASPALSVALALVVGLVAQSLAHHLRLPGIVLLLAAGVLLGPDGAGLIAPEGLGGALRTLVGFAVAVILFEGGLNLDLARLRREASTIRRLVFLGAVVTAIGATLAARFIMGWGWIMASLFGTLVIVTGPTVITPLLRRIRVKSSVATILEAEGVLIDPVGAIVAVLALEVVLNTSGGSGQEQLAAFGFRFGVGVLMGLAGGLLLALLLRFHRLVPDEMQNVFALSVVLALFQVSDWMVHESGILTVTVAGLVFGNLRTQALRDLRDFKEQLTVMFIGLLFVLLAADVRMAEVTALGLPGLATVGALMFVVRPVGVALCTWGSRLTLQERLFLCWLAPRGIVAAAVATVFAQSMDEAQIPGGASLRALVFMVIAVTVLLQGLTGGMVASVLGVRRAASRVLVILGANPLARALGVSLAREGQEVTLVDRNPEAVQRAEQDGLRVLFGNGLEERVLQRAALDSHSACAGSTTNEEVNLLFSRRAQEEFRVKRLYVATDLHEGSVGTRLAREAGAHVLFGGPADLELWSVRLGHDEAAVSSWVLEAPPSKAPVGAAGEEDDGALPEDLLPLVLVRGGRPWPVTEETRFRPGDRVDFAVVEAQRGQAEAWLEGRGWRRAEADKEKLAGAALGGTA